MSGIKFKLELSGVPANGPPEPLVTMQEVEEAINFDVSQVIASINQNSTKLDTITQKINPLNRGSINKYGAKVQQKLADSADGMLQAVLNPNMVEVGVIISKIVEVIEQFDNLVEEKSARLFIFSKRSSAQRLQFLQEKCKETILTLDDLRRRLEGKELWLDAEMELLDDLYQQNLKYYEKLSLYIMAGQQGLASIRSGQLEKYLPDNAPAEAILAQNDLTTWCDSFDQRLQSLEISRTICLQAAPQIRLVQKTLDQILQRIQDSIYHMLNLWKNQMATTLALRSAKTIVETQADLVDAVKRDNNVLIVGLKGFLSAQQTGHEHQNTAATELGRLASILNQHG